MACCCSPHESDATCDVIHSQGSRLPMELRRWSIPCSFHVSQVKTAPVLTSYKSPLIPTSSNIRLSSQFLSLFHISKQTKELDPQLLKNSLTPQHFQYVLRRRRQQLRSTSMPCFLVDQWGY